jgi:hypothetical protein
MDATHLLPILTQLTLLVQDVVQDILDLGSQWSLFGLCLHHAFRELKDLGHASEDFIFLLAGVFLEDCDPAFDLSQVLVERRIGKTATSTWGLVLGGAVGCEVSRGAFEEESEDLEEHGAEGEYVGFLRVVFRAEGP